MAKRFNLTISVIGELGRVDIFESITADSPLQLSSQFTMTLIKIMNELHSIELAEMKLKEGIDDIPF